MWHNYTAGAADEGWSLGFLTYVSAPWEPRSRSCRWCTVAAACCPTDTRSHARVQTWAGNVVINGLDLTIVNSVELSLVDATLQKLQLSCLNEITMKV